MEDYLGGAAVGNVLVRNEHVTRANERFQDLVRDDLQDGLSVHPQLQLEDDRNAILNKVFRLTTPDDVRELVRDLEVTEAAYCGAAGIDCDAESNTGYLRVSLRDLNVPQLDDTTPPDMSSPRASSFMPRSLDRGTYGHWSGGPRLVHGEIPSTSP